MFYQSCWFAYKYILVTILPRNVSKIFHLSSAIPFGVSTSFCVYFGNTPRSRKLACPVFHNFNPEKNTLYFLYASVTELYITHFVHQKFSVQIHLLFWKPGVRGKLLSMLSIANMSKHELPYFKYNILR